MMLPALDWVIHRYATVRPLHGLAVLCFWDPPAPVTSRIAWRDCTVLDEFSISLVDQRVNDIAKPAKHPACRVHIFVAAVLPCCLLIISQGRRAAPRVLLQELADDPVVDANVHLRFTWYEVDAGYVGIELYRAVQENFSVRLRARSGGVDVGKAGRRRGRAHGRAHGGGRGRRAR